MHEGSNFQSKKIEKHLANKILKCIMATWLVGNRTFWGNQKNKNQKTIL